MVPIAGLARHPPVEKLEHRHEWNGIEQPTYPMTNEIQVGRLAINYLVDDSRTDSLGMFELTVPPGANVPPAHSHSNNEESVYVLAGALRYSVGAETRDLSVGQTMSTPRGVVPAFSNPFSETARALIVLSADIGVVLRCRAFHR